MSIVAKAAVKLGSTPADVVHDWLARYQRLCRFGVPTARVLGSWDGILLQIHVPLSIGQWFDCAEASQQAQLSEILLQMAQGVDGAGFWPVDLAGSLRTDGVTICVADFGEDLGHFKEGRHEHRGVALAKAWLRGR